MHKVLVKSDKEDTVIHLRDFFEIDFAVAVFMMASGAILTVLIFMAWILAPFHAPEKLRPGHAVIVTPGEGSR